MFFSTSILGSIFDGLLKDFGSMFDQMLEHFSTISASIFRACFWRDVLKKIIIVQVYDLAELHVLPM